MTLPRITIITPSYNQAQFLNETIESILAQNYPELEYIIIDGGSTDDSIEIIKKYEHRLSFWVSEKDEGQTDAIMKGFRRCSGELFAWVNSDDVLFPGCLNAIAECYKKKKPEIIHSNIAYIDSSSRITRFIRVPVQSHFFFKRGVLHMTAPCVFFKTSFFNMVGGLDTQYQLSMDIDIWIRMIRAGASIERVSDYLGGFRWHDSSKTVQSKISRSSFENPETTLLLNKNLPKSSPFRRAIWRRIYNCYQVVNLNYFLAFMDYKRLSNQK